MRSYLQDSESESSSGCPEGTQRHQRFTLYPSFCWCGAAGDLPLNCERRIILSRPLDSLCLEKVTPRRELPFDDGEADAAGAHVAGASWCAPCVARPREVRHGL